MLFLSEIHRPRKKEKDKFDKRRTNGSQCGCGCV